MKLLLDTHILLWAAGEPEKLSGSARTLLMTPENVLFSVRLFFFRNGDGSPDIMQVATDRVKDRLPVK